MANRIARARHPAERTAAMRAHVSCTCASRLCSGRFGRDHAHRSRTRAAAQCAQAELTRRTVVIQRASGFPCVGGSSVVIPGCVPHVDRELRSGRCPVEARSRRRVAHVGADRARAPAGRANRCDQVLRFIRFGRVVDDDAKPISRETLRNRRADPARGSRHDDCLAFPRRHHSRSWVKIDGKVSLADMVPDTISFVSKDRGFALRGISRARTWIDYQY